MCTVSDEIHPDVLPVYEAAQPDRVCDQPPTEDWLAGLLNNAYVLLSDLLHVVMTPVFAPTFKLIPYD